MKRFIFYIFLNIYISLGIFNIPNAYAVAEDYSNIFTQDLIEQIDITAPQKKSIIKADNDFIKLIATYFLINKLYPGEKINNDIVGFLHLVWPETDVKKLKKIAPFFKYGISLQRRYNYYVEKLKQKVKAANLLPKDAPIVAKDGEFAPIDPHKPTISAPDEYAVSYVPYKYLEYDNLETAIAVHRRDKNYVENQEEIYDEINLAIISFDVQGFVKAIRKLFDSENGIEQKVLLENDLTTRILLDTAFPGRKEKIRGVIEVAVPEGWYINADFITPNVKPRFYLSEDTNEDLNIKDYQLFYPVPYAVTNDGNTQRILVNTVAFPISFTRKDSDYPMKIKGQFTFQLCKAKTTDCHLVVSNNSLTLKPSVDEFSSRYDNYINIKFANLPNPETKHIKLQKAIYNATTKKLVVKYSTTKNISTVMSMAEDASHTNFSNPQYQILENEINVIFDTAINNAQTDDLSSSTTNQTPSTPNIEEGGEIAITTTFNKYTHLRTVVTPEIVFSEETLLPTTKTTPPYSLALLFGLLISLMPLTLYIIQHLALHLMENKFSLNIFIRFALGSLTGLILFLSYIKTSSISSLYENNFIFSTILLLTATILPCTFGQINLDFIRPFRGIIKRGFFIGIFSILLSIYFPIPYKNIIYTNIKDATLTDTFLLSLYIFIGSIIIPFMFLMLNKNIALIYNFIKMLNHIFSILYPIFILWLAYVYKGIIGLSISIFVIIFVFVILRNLPLALKQAFKLKRKKQNRNQILQNYQKHILIFYAVLIAITNIAFSITPSIKFNVPTYEEIVAISKKEDVTLFVFETPWDYNTLSNYINLNNYKTQNENIKIIKIYTSYEDENTQKIMKAFNKNTLPLNILFTKHFNQGIVLPNKLESINWNTILTTKFN